MNIFVVKVWHLLLFFLLTLAFMFFDSAISESKLAMTYDYRKSGENYFALLGESPATNILLGLLLIIALVACFRQWKKRSAIAFAFLISFSLIRVLLPLMTCFDNFIKVGQLSNFFSGGQFQLFFYAFNISFWLVGLSGILFYLLLLKFSFEEK